VTDTDFVSDLERAFCDPTPDTDTAALERAILGRVERADRQRWLTLCAAAALGLAIAIAAAFGSGLVALIRDAWRELDWLELHLSGGSSAWLFAIVGAVVLGSIVREARDA
jgi:uncharacterized membrane protein YcjF (UPF0283 family)